MKRILITSILGFLFSGLFMSCQEDEIKFYTGPVAINMTVDGDGTFVSNETNEEKTFKIEFAVQGEVSDRDRVLKLAFGKGHTAVAGTNFDMPMEVIIEAGRLDTIIECKAYREGLTMEPLMFDLVVDPRIDPSGWAAEYWLGKCTQAKYAFVFEQLGTLDLGPYQGSFGSGYMDLMNKFNKILETDPRLDDDGKVMKFGPGY